MNTKDYTELYSQYSWFANNYPSLVQEACDDFFLPGFEVHLLGISKNVNTLMDKDPYFVTKISIDEFHDVFFRSSENTINILLEKALGRTTGKFNLNKLSDLEAKIVTAFNDYMYNKLTKLMLPPPPTVKRTNFDVIHLTFILKDSLHNSAGKFIVTLPSILLKPESVISQGEKFSAENFLDQKINTKITVGTTKFKLIDVKNIDIGDIVVFDNSNLRHMRIKFKDLEKDFRINPNLGLTIPFDYEEGAGKMDENTNLWDNIEVEMVAQFNPVKITLGDLKNIEQGLVVDLTSIYDNKVKLSVDDRVIASGELVIVNDRYGVKIDEILTGDNQQIPQDEEVVEDSQDNQETEPYTEENNTTPEGGEEEFDYSDFELEDEDI